MLGIKNFCVSFIVLYLNLLYLGFVGSEQETWFASKPRHFEVKSGADVIFPCKHNGSVKHLICPVKDLRKVSAVISWSWNGRLITAGPTRVLEEPRIGIIEFGQELLIRSVQASDSGEYTCTYNLKYKPVTLSHRLDVLVTPTSRILSTSKEISLREGDRIQLHCEKTGCNKMLRTGCNPPDINRLLVIPFQKYLGLKREDQGLYTCSASNSQGISHDSIQIVIQYKPVTRLDKRTVMSAFGSSNQRETIFTCYVDASPEAEMETCFIGDKDDNVRYYRRIPRKCKSGKVTWYKGNIPIYPGMPYIKEAEQLKDGTKYKSHILKLRSLEEKDYGNYTCVASNSLGTSSSSFSVTGSPDQPMIISPSQSSSRDSYTIIWKVWTPHTFPILNQSILYRKVARATGETVTDPEGTWHNLALIAEKRNTFQDSYRMDLTGLTHDCEYEVRIRAMNSQGWSPLSNPFTFKTAGDIYRPLPAVYHEGQIWSSDAAINQSTIKLMSAVVIILLAYL